MEPAPDYWTTFLDFTFVNLRNENPIFIPTSPFLRHQRSSKSIRQRAHTNTAHLIYSQAASPEELLICKENVASNADSATHDENYAQRRGWLDYWSIFEAPRLNCLHLPGWCFYKRVVPKAGEDIFKFMQLFLSFYCSFLESL